jgi:signal transduction histidine kinase
MGRTDQLKVTDRLKHRLKHRLKLSEQQMLGLSAGLVGAVVLLLSWGAQHNLDRTAQAMQRSQQADRVIHQLQGLFTTMTVAESGRRGYIFLQDETEFKRSQLAIGQLRQGLIALHNEAKPLPQQAPALTELESLLKARITLLEESFDLYKTSPTAQEQQRDITVESVKLREQIQQLITQMQEEQQQQQQQWLQDFQISIRRRFWLDFGAVGMGIGLIGAAYWLLQRQMGRRRSAEHQQLKMEQDQALNTLKLRFFSLVSHEFRTPLTIILGSAQMLSDNLGESQHRLAPAAPDPDQGSWPPARTLKTVRRIQASAQQMSHLLTDLLMITRGEAGKLECLPEPLDIEAFCLNLVEDLQTESALTPAGSATAVKPGPRILFTRRGRCGYVHLDERLIYSILTNLLANARKYSPVDQPVSLMLECLAEQVIFEIQDSGRGIASQDLQHLFEPFYRGENVGKVTGVGLGLAVVKICVELHGGSIEVDSQVNQGTQIRVQIPTQKIAPTVHPLTV